MHAYRTSILLVEGDHHARQRHEVALTGAGFSVRSISAWTEHEAVPLAAVIVIDVWSFYVLQRGRIDLRSTDVVVIAADAKFGVAACLRGAADWFPAGADNTYVVETVTRVLNS